MNARQWRMKQAGHTETQSGLTAAWNRGKKLAQDGGNELDLNKAMERCSTTNIAAHLKEGYLSQLAAIYKLDGKQ